MNGGVDWIKALLAGSQRPAAASLRERGQGMIPGMEQPAELTQTPQGQGGDWIKTLLKVLLPAAAGMYAGSQAGFEAPHGGTTGWKGTMGKGLQSFGKAIQQMDEAKAAREQEEREAEAQRQQQEFENTIRKAQFDLQLQEFLRKQYEYEHPKPKEPTPQLPEDIAATEALTEQRKASAAASWALAAERREKAKGTAMEEYYNIPKQDIVSDAGVETLDDLNIAYLDALESGDRSSFDDVISTINKRSNEMVRESAVSGGVYGDRPQITKASTADASRLRSTWNWMNNKLNKKGVKKTAPAGKTEKSPKDVKINAIKRYAGLYEQYKETNPDIAEKYYTRATTIINELNLSNEEVSKILEIKK